MTTTRKWIQRVSDTWTILKVLQWTSGHFTKLGLPSARLDAELLISHALQLPRIQLYAQFEKILQPDELAAIRELVRRRSEFEPVAYIMGRKEFYSESFLVDRSVLIPRPETEFIIEEIKNLFPAGSPARMLDIGTGSGCIAVVVKKIHPEFEVHGGDISPAALLTAEKNAGKILGQDHGIHFHRMDVFDPLDGSTLPETFDLIVSNPPYVPETARQSLMRDVRDYEPSEALFSGTDGMDFTKKLISSAPAHLAPQGSLLFETGVDISEATKKIIDQNLFEVRTARDYSGIERVFILKKKASHG
jgi:release factor glutamine methyltransferase